MFSLLVRSLDFSGLSWVRWWTGLHRNPSFRSVDVGGDGEEVKVMKRKLFLGSS